MYIYANWCRQIFYWQAGAAGLVLFKVEAADLRGLRQQAAFQKAHMGLGEVLVLAHEHDGRYPELLRFVLLQALADDFGLADVRAGAAAPGVGAGQDVHPGLLQLLALQQLLQLRPRSRNRLARPVRDLRRAQTLRVAAGKEEFDGGGGGHWGEGFGIKLVAVWRLAF